MRSGDLVLRNRLGLHARASAQFVQCASQFESSVKLSSDGQEVEAKSILGLLLLAAPCGATVTLTCDGEDEEKCFEALSELVASRFGEDG